MIKDSFVVNGPGVIKPTGVKDLSSFLSTLNTKKFSTLNIWTDGSWSVTHKNNVIKFTESPIISLNISYCKELDRENLNYLANDINSQLTQIQKNLSAGH